MKTVVSLFSADSYMLPVGTRLNGIFEIEGPIGEGGMAHVYRAHTIEAQDAVAIKVIKAHVARDQTLIGLLKKEASTLRKISHESIVKHILFSSDNQLNCQYLVMELVEGPSLADMIKDGPLSIEAVLVLLKKIGSGLDAVHQLGVTHRDISPDNIIIPRSDPGRAKLIDFGIARNSNGGETIIADRFAGKFNFASPEHLGLNGGNVNPKSDIYSFGLTLAAALSGAPLDLGGTQVEMLRCRQVVPDLSKIDPRLRKILARMLQPDPSDRPDSIADLLAGQEGGSVVTARSAPLPGIESRRWAVPIAAGLALVISGLASWYAITRNAGPETAVVRSDKPVDISARKPGQAEQLSEAAPKASSQTVEVGPAPTTSVGNSDLNDGKPAAREQLSELPSPNSIQIRELPAQTAIRQRVQAEPAAVDPPLPPPGPAGRALVASDDSTAAGKGNGALVAVQTPAPAARTMPDQSSLGGRKDRDCGMCPPLAEIPAGTFNMGSAADASEKPVHTVRVRAFLLSRGPVTVSEWNACHAAGMCELKAEGFPDKAAANLSWDDAQQYVRWISDVTKKPYRLPSEAEWEYAARGGTHTRFWWGDQFRSEMAPCRNSNSASLHSTPSPADFPQNPFGLLGTTCVIAQWVSDCWHKNYRGSPIDGGAWVAPNCKQRVLRGGTWRSPAETERATSRDFYDPAVRYPGNGMRVARDL